MNSNEISLEEKILKSINKFNMLPQNAAVVVGVSGGSDSMALLYFLLHFSKIKNLKIIAAHVNHSLRGSESDRDENFVRDFCKDNDVELKVLKVDVAKKAKEMKMGLEECGRLIRYEFFEELASPNNAKIALAHTLSDNIETIILNLTRGSGIHGLCGILPARDNIIRPLMLLEKSEILAYCKANKIKYVEDSSNKDREYSRNKIRLDVVPVLKEINPSLGKAFLKVSSLLQSDDDYLNKIAREKLNDIKIEKGQYFLKELKKLDLAIKSRCIKLAVLEANKNINLDFSHVNLILALIEQGSGTVTLPDKIYVKVEKETLKIFLKEKPVKDWRIQLNSLNNNLTGQARKFIIRVVCKSEYDDLLKQDKTLLNRAVDYEKIPPNSVLRNRRPGDVLKLSKRGITKSLKKFFNEEKVSIEKRSELSMIADKNNILWLEEFGACEPLKINNNTKQVLIINIGRN
ncbi:MAG: tRNA(Ile)-lysidine synthase [Eubacteriales bacterium SKADARSKE-1]|nr:tRNA(Ile)-lysidine synthase [Eubacteriales bacterium SKADARSKE-1]